MLTSRRTRPAADDRHAVVAGRATARHDAGPGTLMPPTHRLLRPLPASLLLAATAAAQDLDALRQQLREDLGSVHFAQSLLGLVMLSDELELSGASYWIDDDVSTDVSTFSLPFHSTVDLWGGDRPRLHVEGTVGWAQARQGTADLYRGLLPGLETTVDTKWTTYGGLVGVGLQFQPREQLTITPLLDLGLAYLDNDTRLTGPGAAVTAALTDGIAFNWDAFTLSYGVALRACWQQPLGEHHRLVLTGRYDVRWNDAFATDDPAQDFTTRTQLLTLYGDLFGPAGFDVFGVPAEWQLTPAYRAFVEGDLFSVDGYLELGASLLIHTGDQGLPGTDGFAVGGAVMLGDDLTGWTFGCRVLF